VNEVICCLPLDVHKDLASVAEIEGGDTEIIVQEKVPSVLHIVLENKFKKTEEQHQDSHCENSDSGKKSNVGNTNQNRPLPAPNHKEAKQCVSQFNIPRPTNLSVSLIFLSVQQY